MAKQVRAKGQLRELDVEEFLAESVRVDPLLLEDEFVRLPADVAYWNERSARALREHMMKDMALHRERARLGLEIREELALAGGKVTEAMIEAAILSRPEYEHAKLESIDAEVEKTRLRGVAEAMSKKCEMIVSLGAHIRKEMDGDPLVREQHKASRIARANNE